MSPAKRTHPPPSPTPQPLLVLSPDHCFLTSLPRPNFSPNNPATPLESALPQNQTSPPVTPIESTPFFTITHIFARSAPATPVSTTLTKYPSCNPRRMNTSAKHPVAPNATSPLTNYYSMTYTRYNTTWSYHFAHTQLPPSNLPAQPRTADSIATSSNATNSSAASSSAASSSTANSSSGPRESRRHSRPIRTLSYTGCGGEKGPVTFPAFKAGDSFLRGPNGGFDSHTPPPSPLRIVIRSSATKYETLHPLRAKRMERRCETPVPNCMPNYVAGCSAASAGTKICSTHITARIYRSGMKFSFKRTAREEIVNCSQVPDS